MIVQCFPFLRIKEGEPDVIMELAFRLVNLAMKFGCRGTSCGQRNPQRHKP
jgi:hypothetical protein